MAGRALTQGLLTALLLLAVTPAWAQDLPATFRVTGVAARDVLNVRAAPAFGAAVLSTLAPTATGVEVLAFSSDGAWARLPLQEGEGWVARRFLQAEPAAPGLPRPARCLGTEPFWSLTLDPGSATFEEPGLPPAPLVTVGGAAGLGGSVEAFEGAERVLDLTVARGACSDGMSDRPYGLRALLWDRGDRLLEGCCTLQR